MLFQCNLHLLLLLMDDHHFAALIAVVSICAIQCCCHHLATHVFWLQVDESAVDEMQATLEHAERV